MPLPNILFPPDGEQGLSEWSFAHQQDHNEIAQAVNRILGTSLTFYQLDPVNWNDRKSWLLQHQSAHTDFNQILQLSGQDLQSVDLDKPDELRAWMYEQFIEHQSARARLGI